MDAEKIRLKLQAANVKAARLEKRLRDIETRRKIIIGAAVELAIAQHEKQGNAAQAKAYRADIDRFVTRPADRETLGLAPRAESPASSSKSPIGDPVAVPK